MSRPISLIIRLLFLLCLLYVCVRISKILNKTLKTVPQMLNEDEILEIGRIHIRCRKDDERLA